MSGNYRLLDMPVSDQDAAVRNARILASRCRAQDEAILPMAADVAQMLADRTGMRVEAYGLSSGALAELIDHLADEYERAIQE